MRILITGATSMIGSALLERFVLAGHQVVAIARPDSSRMSVLLNKGSLVETVYCNMEDYASISKLVKGKVDAAALMAWNGTRGKDRMNDIIQRYNEIGNTRLLTELEKLGCHTIMTAGSQAEYGPWKGEIAQTEDTLPAPNTEYGKSKLRFYHTALDFCSKRGIRLIEPRIFSIYGPDDNENTLIMSLLRAMLKNEPCMLTKCVQMWDYLYIDDAVAGLAKLLMENHPGGIYNLGSGDCRPLRDYVEEMYRVTGSHSTLQYGAIPYPDTGAVNIHPDVSKMRSIGWAPSVSFAQGLRMIMREKQYFAKDGAESTI